MSENEYYMWIEGIESELYFASKYLRKGQITKACLSIDFCIEYLDEIEDMVNNEKV